MSGSEQVMLQSPSSGGSPIACVGDPYYSCDPSVATRRVLSLHMGDIPRDTNYANRGGIIDFIAGHPVDYGPDGCAVVDNAGVVDTSVMLFQNFPTYAPDVAAGAGIDVSSAFLSTIGILTSTIIIEGWFYQQSSTGIQYIFEYGSGSTNRMGLRVNAGAFQYVFGNGAYTTTGTAVLANTWYYYMVYAIARGPGQPGIWDYGVRCVNLAGVTLGGVGGGGVAWAATSAAGLCIGNGKRTGTGPFAGRLGPVRFSKNNIAANLLSDGLPPFGAFPLQRGVDFLADTSCANPKTVTFEASGFDMGTVLGNDRQGYHACACYQHPTFGLQTNGARLHAHSDFNFGVNDFTIVIPFQWKPRLGNNYYLLQTQWAASAGVFLQVFVNAISGQLQGGVFFSTGNVAFTAFLVPTVDTWYELVIQRRGSNVEVGVNGTLALTLPITSPGTAVADYGQQDWMFGNKLGPTNEAWSGLIGQIFVWKGAAVFNWPYAVASLPFCDSTTSHFVSASASVGVQGRRMTLGRGGLGGGLSQASPTLALLGQRLNLGDPTGRLNATLYALRGRTLRLRTSGVKAFAFNLEAQSNRSINMTDGPSAGPACILQFLTDGRIQQGLPVTGYEEWYTLSPQAGLGALFEMKIEIVSPPDGSANFQYATIPFSALPLNTWRIIDGLAQFQFYFNGGGLGSATIHSKIKVSFRPSAASPDFGDSSKEWFHVWNFTDIWDGGSPA